MKTFDGYKKQALTDVYALLAGGGHKPLSEFSMAHTHPYLPLTGGTVTGNIILKGRTSTDMTYKGNVHPYIRFDNSDSSQNVSLIFTDYDSYRAPAGLKLVGSQGNEWFEAAGIISKWAFINTGDSTLKIYDGKITDGKSDGNICLQTSINGTDGQSHTYPTLYGSRCNLVLQPRGGQVYIGNNPDGGNKNYKLYVNGNVYASSFTGNASSATKLTSSAGNAALPIYFSDGKPIACTASSIFSNLSNSGNNLSITIAGQNRTLTVAYATTSSILKTSAWHGGAYVSSDTHYMCLGYMNCTNSYDALTLLISSAFWGNQHGSQDIITIQQDTNTNNTKTIQTTVGRLRLGGSHERTFYYYKDNTNLRLYLYVYVIGGNSYGKWNISYLGGNATWVNDWQTNVTKDTSWITIGYSAQVNYATSAGNATTATTLLTTRTLWGQSFNGSTNVSGNMSSVGLITFSTLSGTNGRALLYLQMADNDYFRIYAGGTASNSGYVEIATADDGNEPIYVRQYTGVFSTLKRTLTLLDGSGNTILPGSATATGFSKSGSSNSYILLGGGSHKAISDFMLKTDELSNNLTTISKSLTVTQAWMDTGIKNTDLPANGTYIVQVSAHNTADNIWHNYWSGIMSWYKDGTNDSDSDEIILHRAGHAYHHTIYLRTIMTTNSDGRHLRLQIAADTNLSTAVTYTFKFKRVI